MEPAEPRSIGSGAPEGTRRDAERPARPL